MIGTRSIGDWRALGPLCAIASALTLNPIAAAPVWAQQRPATTVVFAGSNVMAEQVMPTLLQTWARNRKTPIANTEGSADPRDCANDIQSAVSARGAR